MKYSIIGAGIAGYSAALAIRKQDPQGEIEIFSEEGLLPYYRPRLVEYLAGKTAFEKIHIKPASFLKEKGIQLNASKVTSLNVEEKKLETDQGTSSWDKLLIATGAEPFVPPIPGADRNGVFCFRTKVDADQIKDRLAGGPVILIGGGLLGLETAFSLVEIGCRVTVVEFFDRLLPRQLNFGAAAFLQREIEKAGISFRLGVKTEAILGDSGVTGIRLDNGEEIQADGIVISAGVRPRLALAEPAGIKKARGIKVNKHLETSVADVYAAGDVAEFDRLYGLWLPSRDQGTVAGNRMSGGKAEYDGSSFEARLKVAGIPLFSFGNVEEEDTDENVIETASSYTRILRKEEKIVGALSVGDPKIIQKLSQVVSGRIDIVEAGIFQG